MRSVHIKEANVVIGAGQGQYSPIHAYKYFNEEYGNIYIMCWELSIEEIFRILQTRRFWYSRASFDFPPSLAFPDGISNPFQPLTLTVENPLVNKIDDTLATPAFSSGLMAFILRFSSMRANTPEKSDVDPAPIRKIFNGLIENLDKYSPDCKSKAYEEIANLALRLSEIHKNNP